MGLSPTGSTKLNVVSTGNWLLLLVQVWKLAKEIRLHGNTVNNLITFNYLIRVDGRVDEGDGLQNHLVIPHVGSNPSRRAVLHFSKFLKRGDCL